MGGHGTDWNPIHVARDWLGDGRVTNTNSPWHPISFDATFKNLRVGLVDGTVAAVAERRQVYRVLTTDRRDFGAIRIGPRFTRALELLP